MHSCKLANYLKQTSEGLGREAELAAVLLADIQKIGSDTLSTQQIRWFQELAAISYEQGMGHFLEELCAVNADCQVGRVMAEQLAEIERKSPP